MSTSFTLLFAIVGAVLVALSPTPATGGLALALALLILVPARADAGSASEDTEGSPKPQDDSVGVALAMRFAQRALEPAALLLGAGLCSLVASGPSLLALVYLTLWAGFLAGLCHSLGALGASRGAQALATIVGAVLLGFPYLAGPFLGGVEPTLALDLTLHLPLAVLCGTCAEVDVLRMGSLYRIFPAAQRVPYAYPAFLAAAAPLLAANLALWFGPLLARLRAPRGAAPIVGAGLLFLLASPAQAQGLFPPPSPAAGATGDLGTRVRLGYYLPRLKGQLRVDPKDNNAGFRPAASDFSFRRHLDLNDAFVVPTFEIELSWPNAGGLRIQYLENVWTGETENARSFTFEESILTRNQQIDVRYRYRTIALGGHLDIPVADFITLRLMSTFRYVKNEVKIRASPQLFSRRNSQEAFLPTVGGGLDIFVWNVISAYADIQWLDFRTSWFGNENDRFRFRYREWRAGVRLELVEHAFILVEYYSLFTYIRDGQVEAYETDLNGLRVMVSILF